MLEEEFDVAGIVAALEMVAGCFGIGAVVYVGIWSVLSKKTASDTESLQTRLPRNRAANV